MSPAWHQVVLAFLSRAKLTRRLHQLRYFTVENAQGVTEIVGFFYLSKSAGQKVIHFTHLLGPSDYYDFVYSTAGASKIGSALLLKIMEDNGAQKIQFSHSYTPSMW